MAFISKSRYAIYINKIYSELNFYQAFIIRNDEVNEKSKQRSFRLLKLLALMFQYRFQDRTLLCGCFRPKQTRTRSELENIEWIDQVLEQALVKGNSTRCAHRPYFSNIR